MNRDAIDFENGKVTALFRQLFIPTLIGSLSLSAMTAIDGIFIGHGVGSDGVAAVNIIAPIWILFSGFGLMVGAGCSVVTAIHLSQKKLKVARLNVSQALVFASLVALAVTVAVMAFPDQTAMMLGSSENLKPLVRSYLMGMMPCFVFDMWSFIGLFVIRLDGSPKVAMWCNAVSSICNIVLDWLMIFVFGWGIFGAAVASTISVALSGLMVMVYLFAFSKSLRPVGIKLSRKSLKLALRNVGYHCRIGSSSLLGEVSLSLFIFVGNAVFMHYLGDDGVGAFGVACYYTPFLFMVGNSIAQSAQPIISFNYGIGRMDRVKKALRLLIGTALVSGLVVTLCFVGCPQQLVGFFLDTDTDAARMAVEGFPLFAAGFVATIINVAAVGYLQSVEQVRLSTFFSLLRGLLFLLPCFYLLPMLWGVPGIWLASAATELLTLVVIVGVMGFRQWREGKRRDNSE